MTPETPSSAILRFATFEVDLRTGELRKQGVRVKLQEQPFHVLIALLQRPGTVVTREELRSQLWQSDTFVDFDNGLNTCINKLREALGDSADNPRFIETLPRRGYRFLAPVTKDGVENPATAAVGRKVVLRGAVAVVLLVAAVAFAGMARWWTGRSANPPVRSIAVLPFTNLSGDPNQEYFADGMTEELVTELGKVGALRVISHTSVNRFKGTKASLQEIAGDLQVDALVEGVVTRDGNRVRVTANLVQAFPERHVWAQSYDRDLRNVLDLQSEIARTVADQIKIAVTPEERLRLTASQPLDPEAHELLLKGDFYIDKWSHAGSQKAIEYFNQSLQRDPRNARAYAGLALAYATLGISDPSAYCEGLPILRTTKRLV